MKKNKSFTDLSAKKQLEVKNKYLSHVPVSQIAKDYDIPRTSLDYHVRSKWAAERAIALNDSLAAFAAGKRPDFIDISTKSTDILKRGLEFLNKRTEPPSVKELGQVAKILETIDKIMRLDDGDPTSITAEKPLSIKEIKAQLKSADPFNTEEIEVVEYTEDDS